MYVLKTEGFRPFAFKHAFQKHIYVNKQIIAVILNNHYRNSRGTGNQ